MLRTCWLLFLHSAVQLIQHDNRVIVEARLSDEALHHSPSWSNSPYTAWRCVLGLCPVEKQMIVPLSLKNAVVAMLVKCALNSK